MDCFVISQESFELTTYPKIFDNFPKQLMYYHKRVFMKIIYGVTKTVPHFNYSLNKLKYSVLEVLNYE